MRFRRMNWWLKDWFCEYAGFMTFIAFVVLSVGFLAVKGCNSNNLEYVKQHGPDKWRSVGFEIVGYDGYTRRLGYETYGGAQVWWYLKRVPDNGLLYNGYLERWGDELHAYNVKSVEGNITLPRAAYRPPEPEPKIETVPEPKTETKIEPAPDAPEGQE